MRDYNQEQRQGGYKEAPTHKLHTSQQPGRQALFFFFSLLIAGSFLLVGMQVISSYTSFGRSQPMKKHQAINQIVVMSIPTPTPSPMPVPFDPNVGAVLPQHRVVAFYAVPGAQATGPAYLLSSAMLSSLRAQGAAYQKLDPQHPVQLGIDLVASVPDGYPGPNGV